MTNVCHPVTRPSQVVDAATSYRWIGLQWFVCCGCFVDAVCPEDEVAIMITITRFDKRVIVLNVEMIKTIEAIPDTMITLINGDTILVRETVEEVVERAIEYARRLHGFRVV